MHYEPENEQRRAKVRLILNFLKAEALLIGPMVGLLLYYTTGDLMIAGLSATGVCAGGMIAYIIMKRKFHELGLSASVEESSSKQSETL